MVVADDRLELVEERLAFLQPAGRKVGGCAANREIAVGQPSAAGLFKEVEDFFPLAKGVEKGAETTQIEPVGAHADEVTGDAPHLGDDHA